jgi:hypothetical protein
MVRHNIDHRIALDRGKPGWHERADRVSRLLQQKDVQIEEIPRQQKGQYLPAAVRQIAVPARHAAGDDKASPRHLVLPHHGRVRVKPFWIGAESL